MSKVKAQTLALLLLLWLMLLFLMHHYNLLCHILTHVLGMLHPKLVNIWHDTKLGVEMKKINLHWSTKCFAKNDHMNKENYKKVDKNGKWLIRRSTCNHQNWKHQSKLCLLPMLSCFKKLWSILLSWISTI